MFPVIKVLIEGLDPRAMYSVELEFAQIGSNRWKYMNGDWVTGGKAEPPPASPFNRYTHPEAPHFGHHWMREEISFSKVKLTNKPSPQSGQVSCTVYLQPGHSLVPASPSDRMSVCFSRT